MKRTNSGVIIFILAAVVIAILFMMSALRKTAGDMADAKSSEDLNTLITELSSEDYMIYYLGTPPQELISENIKMTVIPQEHVNSDFLPVSSVSLTYTEYDEDGNLVDQHAPRDYARFMLIYVDSSITLTDSTIELLRNCAVENHVPIIFEGKTNIVMFREALLLTRHTYEDIDTMMFTPWNSGEDHVFTTNEVTDKGVAFATNLLAIMKQITVDQVQYYNDALENAPTYTTAESTTEETTVEETEESGEIEEEIQGEGEVEE